MTRRSSGFARRASLAAARSPSPSPFHGGWRTRRIPLRPTAGGRPLLQRIKGLKQELHLPVGAESVAAASFNLHERFFGDAFDIRLPDGTAASSACVAFGVERWTLAFLAAHGTDARAWPAVPTDITHETIP